MLYVLEVGLISVYNAMQTEISVFYSSDSESPSAPPNYLCNINIATLTSVLARLLPECLTCNDRRLRICVEKCCAAHPLFCPECEQDKHYLHLTNDIRMLFVHPCQYTGREGISTTVKGLMEFLKSQKDTACNLQAEITKLIDEYDKSIQHLTSVIENIDKDSDWQEELQKTLESYLRKETMTTKARLDIARCLSKINFENQPKIKENAFEALIERVSSVQSLTQSLFPDNLSYCFVSINQFNR